MVSIAEKDVEAVLKVLIWGLFWGFLVLASPSLPRDANCIGVNKETEFATSFL